ncbi:MAG: hypothetical protein M5U34_33930 [Chloroflexi bacterium]|nr:hypothetical protein [Chloroflexota bacterium]
MDENAISRQDILIGKRVIWSQRILLMNMVSNEVVEHSLKTKKPPSKIDDGFCLNKIA